VSIKVKSLSGINYAKSYELLMDKMFTLTYLRKQLIQVQLSEETTYPILTYLRKQLIQVQPIWGNNLSNFDLSEETTYPSSTYLQKQLIEIWPLKGINLSKPSKVYLNPKSI